MKWILLILVTSISGDDNLMTVSTDSVRVSTEAICNAVGKQYESMVRRHSSWDIDTDITTACIFDGEGQGV